MTAFDRTEAERLIMFVRGQRAGIVGITRGEQLRIADQLEAALAEIDRLTRYEREFADAALALNAARVPLAIDCQHLTMCERVTWLARAAQDGHDRAAEMTRVAADARDVARVERDQLRAEGAEVTEQRDKAIHECT